MLSEFQGQSNQYRSMASESTTAANTVGSQLFKTMQTARGRESVTGQGSNSAISESQNLVNSWSENLQIHYGWSKNVADTAARRAFIEGGFNAGVDGKLGLEALGTGGGISGGVSARGGTQQDSGQTFSTSAEERIQQGFDFLNSESRSSQATQSRDSFYRSTSSSSDSEVRGLTQRRDASLTEAQTYSAEASRINDAGKRYESALSTTDSGGFQWSRDMSQEYVQFANRELANNPSLRNSGYEVWMTGELSPDQQRVRGILERKFESSFIDQMKQDLGPIGPLPARPIDAPSSGSAAEVSAWGNRQIGAANSGAPSITVGSDARDPALTGLVAGRLDGSDGRMDGHRLQAGADGVLAHRLGDGVQDYATERNNSSLIRTMPVVGPAISYVERNLGTTTFDARPYAAAHGVAIKPGSNLSTLDVKMAPVISEVAVQTRGMGLTAPTVTSAQDRRHTSDSLHPDGLALDFRGNNITVKEGRALARRVDAQLGPGYDVFFESSKRNPDNNHLHAEYDGKGVPRKRK
jgi:conjugal transfer mating pair stabilization protein TraG